MRPPSSATRLASDDFSAPCWIAASTSRRRSSRRPFSRLRTRTRTSGARSRPLRKLSRSVPDSAPQTQRRPAHDPEEHCEAEGDNDNLSLLRELRYGAEVQVDAQVDARRLLSSILHHHHIFARSTHART